MYLIIGKKNKNKNKSEEFQRGNAEKVSSRAFCGLSVEVGDLFIY